MASVERSNSSRYGSGCGNPCPSLVPGAPLRIPDVCRKCTLSFRMQQRYQPGSPVINCGHARASATPPRCPAWEGRRRLGRSAWEGRPRKVAAALGRSPPSEGRRPRKVAALGRSQPISEFRRREGRSRFPRGVEAPPPRKVAAALGRSQPISEFRTPSGPPATNGIAAGTAALDMPPSNAPTPSSTIAVGTSRRGRHK